MARSSKSILANFLWLVFLLSVPLWIAAYFLNVSELVPVRLPVSALQFLVVLVAAIMAVRRGGKPVRPLLLRGLDVGRIKHPAWLLGVFVIMPLAVAGAYFLTVLSDAPTVAASTPLSSLILFVILYGVSAYCEETGWTVIMTDGLLKKYSPFVVGAMVGLVWLIWHAVPFMQTGNTLEWVIWQSVFTFIFRILIVQVYVATGRSVFGAIALHATYNVAFSMLPYYGSSYSPMFMTLAIVPMVLLLVLWRAPIRRPA